MTGDGLRGAEAPLFHVTARFCGSCGTACEDARRTAAGTAALHAALTLLFSG